MGDKSSPFTIWQGGVFRPQTVSASEYKNYLILTKNEIIAHNDFIRFRTHIFYLICRISANYIFAKNYFAFLIISHIFEKCIIIVLTNFVDKCKILEKYI